VRVDKVLIVEDDTSIATVIRHHLQGAGYVGHIAQDVEEAWRLLVAESPAAAIVDIKLPGADGWNLIERVRTDGRFSQLPIVVLTGLVEPQVIDRAARSGCSYLSKPFASSTLLHKLGLAIKARPDQPPSPLSEHDLRIDLVPTDVTILIEGYRVEGRIYLPPEMGRFSDAWEAIVRDQREFLPVTEAKLIRTDGSTATETHLFQVRKSQVHAVFPGRMGEAPTAP
jgi:CheY-like chemotaxis protein